MLSVHLFIILSGLILPSSILCHNCPFIECPPGWRMWRRSCYRFTLSLPWGAAKESCQSMGGEMIAPRSQAENDFFVRFIKDINPDWGKIWLACDDQDVEGEWMCNNIQQTNTFTDWNDGEPNSNGDEDCSAISKGRNEKWNDDSCDNNYPAICYRKPTH